MRKLLLFVVLLASLCFLPACTSNNDTPSISEKYKSVAQEYIDKGDIETAKKALEEGISITNDETLKSMLEEIVSNENNAVDDVPMEETSPKETNEAQANLDSSQPESFDPSTVEGLYFPSKNSDGTVVITNYTGSTIDFAICCIGANQTAGVIGQKEIQNGECNFEYQDTQGNIGKGKLTLGNGKLNLELSTSQYFGNYSIDMAKGEYYRAEDVPSDLIIYEYCDGGIIY